MLKQLAKYFHYFWPAKKVWRIPRRSEVLIFDICNQHLLMWYFGNWNPEALHVRGEEINMLVLIASLFAKGKKSDAYVDCYIRMVRPKLVITFVDNNPGFFSISSRHSNVKTLFLQNGIRGYHWDVFEYFDRFPQSTGRYKVDYMMTVGQRVGQEFTRYVDGQIVPIGSLINNRIPRTAKAKPGTIAYVSQYRISNGLQLDDRLVTRHEFWEKADHCILSFLLDYAKRNDKELFIIPAIIPAKNWYSSEDLQGERSYYNDLLGHKFSYFEGDGFFACYEGADSAEIVVGVDSTLGFEAAARGTKAALLTIRSSMMDVPGYTYGWPEPYPDEGPFWTNRPDHAVFERILNHLFAIDTEEWRRELAESGFDNIMAYDPGNTILQSLIAEELGSSPMGA